MQQARGAIAAPEDGANKRSVIAKPRDRAVVRGFFI